MNKSKKIIVAVILIAVVLMAIGYAALSNVELTIDGSAKAIIDNTNFKVYFSGVSKNSGTGATATVTAKQSTATVTITDLQTVNEPKYVILEIVNESKDIDATSVKVTTQQKSTDYIGISAVMCDENGTPVEGDNPLAVGEKTYVKVSAELLKTITSNKETQINVTVTAVPEELE